MKHPHARHRTSYEIKMNLLGHLTQLNKQETSLLTAAKPNDHKITFARASHVMQTSHRQARKFVNEMIQQGLIEMEKDELEFAISITPKGVEMGQYFTAMNAMLVKPPTYKRKYRR